MWCGNLYYVFSPILVYAKSMDLYVSMLFTCVIIVANKNYHRRNRHSIHTQV